MQKTRNRLPTEIQEALVNLLLGAADFDKTSKAITVVTTAPGIWVPFHVPPDSTFLDVSDLFGPTIWQTEADIIDRVIARISDAGWPRGLIRTDDAHRSSIKHGADVMLIAPDGSPYVTVDVRASSRWSASESLSQAQSVARKINARFAVTTDGERYVVLDLWSDTTEGRPSDRFPSPHDLGLNVTDHDEHQLGVTGGEPGQGVSLVRCNSVSALETAITNAASSTVVVDFTIPWGDRWARLDDMRHPLPEPLRNMSRLDSVVAALGLTVAHPTIQRLVAITPRFVAEAQIYARVRSWIAASLPLAGVIELPSNLFSPVATLNTVLLVLDAKGRAEPGPSAFALATTPGDVIKPELQSWFQDFLTGLSGSLMRLGFKAQVAPDQPWTIAAHHPEVRFTEERIRRLADTALLGEICDVIQGIRHSREEVSRGAGVPIVRGRDLASTPLTQEALTSFSINESIPDRVRLIEGDILIQRIGTSPRIVIASRDLVGTVVGDTVIILRPKTEQADSWSLYHFLRSQAGQTILASRRGGATALTTSIAALRSIPVPVFGAKVSQALESLQHVEQDLRARADRLESMRLGLFNVETPDQFQAQLRDVRHTASALASSLEQAGSLQYQLRNLYPYPLVYPYRSLESRIDPNELYKEELRVAENVLAFLGSLGLALINPLNRADSGIVPDAIWRSGISPGHWWGRIFRPTANVLRQHAGSELASSLASLTTRKHRSFSEAIDALIQAKNDFKHDRTVVEEEVIRQEATRIRSILDHVMQTLSFLTEYPIRLISEVSGVRGSSTRALVHTLRLVGDHPALPQERLEYPGLLTRNDLYVQVGEESWSPLFPFITVRLCPHCKARETYFIDRWEGPGKPAQLKSFERGHTEEDGDVGAELARWLY